MPRALVNPNSRTLAGLGLPVLHGTAHYSEAMSAQLHPARLSNSSERSTTHMPPTRWRPTPQTASTRLATSIDNSS